MPTRAGPCTAVIAGGSFLLVDVGPGSWEQVDLANLPIARAGRRAAHALPLRSHRRPRRGHHAELDRGAHAAARRLRAAGRRPHRGRAARGLRLRRRVPRRPPRRGLACRARPRSAVAHEIALPPEGSIAGGDRARAGRPARHRLPRRSRAGVAGRRLPLRLARPLGRGLGRHAQEREPDRERARRRPARARGAPARADRARGGIARRLGLERVAKLAGDIPGYHTTPREAAEVAPRSRREAAGAHATWCRGRTNALARRLFLDGAGASSPARSRWARTACASRFRPPQCTDPPSPTPLAGGVAGSRRRARAGAGGSAVLLVNTHLCRRPPPSPRAPRARARDPPQPRARRRRAPPADPAGGLGVLRHAGLPRDHHPRRRRRRRHHRGGALSLLREQGGDLHRHPRRAHVGARSGRRRGSARRERGRRRGLRRPAARAARRA